MDILDTARELGSAIAGSEEMQRLKKAETALESDENAKLLMEGYKELQIELVRASKEKKDATAISDIRDRLIAKQQQLNDYGTTFEYLDAKSSFDRFMKTINDVITFSITGEMPCSSDKCSSCKGCG